MNGLKGAEGKRYLVFNTLHQRFRFIYFRRVFVAKNKFLKLNKTHWAKRTLNVCTNVKVFANKFLKLNKTHEGKKTLNVCTNVKVFANKFLK